MAAMLKRWSEGGTDGVAMLKKWSEAECTKIAHRCSLAISTADEGIAGNSAARTIFTHFLRRRNRGSLSIVFIEEIAHLSWGLKKVAVFLGSVKTGSSKCRFVLLLKGQFRDRCI